MNPGDDEDSYCGGSFALVQVPSDATSGYMPHSVCFVGISGKPDGIGRVAPLSEHTLSGKIISQVEDKLRSRTLCVRFYRENLVQNPPLKNGKLRYPTIGELKSEWGSFIGRLSTVKPNVVILLGQIVAEFFRRQIKVALFANEYERGALLKWAGVDEKGLLVLAVAHPSYVGVYARKRLPEYADIISEAVHRFSGGIKQCEPD